jgi:23S rRNA (adenine2503-C2)-methyltransferase
MIDGVNDTPQQAQLLARRVKPLGAHVNLIPLNHVDERSFQPSTPDNLRRFLDILTENGVNVTIRRRLGSDVNASCGQLRRSVMRDRQ